MDAAALTHLFSDLEGSTRLWEVAPDRMGVALAAHDAAARCAVKRHAGRLVKTTGDGLYAVFPEPLQAVLAAVDFQLALIRLADEMQLPLHARCALHRGMAAERDGDYYGPNVNRVARMTSAAHGGQVLLSQALVDALGPALPSGMGVLALGRVRLRDLTQPEPVYQLLHPSLPGTFPALRSLETAPNNLPIQATALVGRHGALVELAGHLCKSRLITIIGPGGIGKTRVALQLAADALEMFPDGAWFVDLAAVGDPGMVAARVADALGVASRPDSTLERAVLECLSTRTCLLVLDNCEHVIEAAAHLASAVLTSGGSTRIVATTREPLRLSGEVTYALPPLALPPDDYRDTAGRAALLQYPAVALFLERARERAGGNVALTDRTIDAIVAVCRRLDGIPLALELAAGRLPALSVVELEQRLAQQLRVLRGGSRAAAPRHRTLDSLVRWSYDLLHERERVAFARLSHFAGPFDLISAQAVCGGAPLDDIDWLDLVCALVDKSLLVPLHVAGEGALRYRMLEPLRAFGRERLGECGEVRDVAMRHANWLMGQARTSPGVSDSASAALFERLDALRDDVVAVLSDLAALEGCGSIYCDLAYEMSDYWHARGRLTEARAALERAVSLDARPRGSREHALLELELAQTAFLQGDLRTVSRLAADALHVFRTLGDRSFEGATLDVIAKARNEGGDASGARAAFREAIDCFRACGRRDNESKALLNLSHTYFEEGALDEAIAVTRAAALAAHEAGVEKVAAYAEFNLANFEYEAGRAQAALAHCERARAPAERLGLQHLLLLIQALQGEALFTEGRADLAWPLVSRALDGFVANDMQLQIPTSLELHAHAARLAGALDAAAALYGYAHQSRLAAGTALSATEQARRDERIAALRERMGASFDEHWELGRRWTREQALCCARRIAATQVRVEGDRSPPPSSEDAAVA